MKFTTTELTRLIGYVAGILVGLGFVTYGLLNDDLPTALAGAGMLGLGGVAGFNINKSDAPAITSDDYEEVELGKETEYSFLVSDEGQEVPTAGSIPQDAPKHA